ncbi:MAG: alpha/beta hydrolase family protein [Isosphaeraceae bacterium]
MAISCRCDRCGRTYELGDQWAGKNVKCKDCGGSVTIPSASAGPAPDLDVYGLNDPEPASPVGLAPGSPRVGTGQSGRARAPSITSAKTKSAQSGGHSSRGKMAMRTAIGTMVVVALIGLGVCYRYLPGRARQENRRAAAAAAGAEALVPGVARRPGAPAPTAAQPSRDETITALPDLGPGTDLAPGIRFHEVKLGSRAGATNRVPSRRGKLWLYVPAGDRPPRSLPCVLIAPAGSNLITGMDLGDRDRAEHLPYARVGFVVVAYELDGALPNREKPSEQDLRGCIAAFADAGAGLVDARVALDFATTRVPVVDPQRIFAVGHSSAGTLALLIAENEPRVAGCVAFAPAVDLAIKYPPQIQQQLTQTFPPAKRLFAQLNPRTSESDIQCPVFLFYADDDAPFAGQVHDLAQRLSSAGKTVTAEHVTEGGHYDSMIREGIPRAIYWLMSLPPKSRSARGRDERAR